MNKLARKLNTKTQRHKGEKNSFPLCLCVSVLKIVFFLLPVSISATEFEPWFGKDKLIESRISYTYRHFSHVNQGSHSSHYTSNDNFINLGLRISPVPEWDAEMELIAADTRKRSFGIDNFRLRGSYLLFDDVIGDPISLVIGLTIDRATKAALHDLSSFHHGQMEYATYVSFGKEVSCEQFWTSRYWGKILLGIADHGSPWLNTYFAYEKNRWDYHQWRLFADGLFGFGKHRLSLHKHFHGYGPIAHRSIDIGGRYSYLLNFGTISAEYAYRIWAFNFPAQAHTFYLSLMIPFGF